MTWTAIMNLGGKSTLLSPFTIASCVKNPAKSRYDCVTQSGKKIRVLLRWKNGNGIAFPAFQIS